MCLHSPVLAIAFCLFGWFNPNPGRRLRAMFGENADAFGKFDAPQGCHSL
jgi:hypothetical protein